LNSLPDIASDLGFYEYPGGDLNPFSGVTATWGYA